MAFVRGANGFLYDSVTNALIQEVVAWDEGKTSSGGGGGGGSSIRSAAVELTRPNNSIQYDFGDAITNSTTAPTPLVMPNVATANGGGVAIVGALLTTDKKDFSGIRIRVHLLNTAPTVTPNDNVQYGGRYLDKEEEQGYIDFPAMEIDTDQTGSTRAISQPVGIYVPFVCAAGDTSLYPLPEIRDVGLPAANQKFYLKLFFG